MISQKLSFKLFFLKLEYAGQNENNGIYPKKFGVIFFQPLLLDSKHGEIWPNCSLYPGRKLDIPGKYNLE